MNCTIYVAKTEALISFAVTVKLLSVFVFSHMQNVGFPMTWLKFLLDHLFLSPLHSMIVCITGYFNLTHSSLIFTIKLFYLTHSSLNFTIKLFTLSPLFFKVHQG